MPNKTGAAKPNYPPIDKLKAVLLERKLSMGYTYDDFAVAANTNSAYIRKMFSKFPTSQWNPEIKTAICKMCGIGIRTTIVDLYEVESVRK